jgi:hypothetical protein
MAGQARLSCDSTFACREVHHEAESPARCIAAGRFSGSAGVALPGRHEADRRGADKESETDGRADMAEVRKFRAEGEALHKAAKHRESVDTLVKAMKILDIK